MYQADIESETALEEGKEKHMKYIGMTEGSFKQRFTHHKSDINSANRSKGVTKLAKHIWDLEEKAIEYNFISSIRHLNKGNLLCLPLVRLSPLYQQEG